MSVPVYCRPYPGTVPPPSTPLPGASPVRHVMPLGAALLLGTLASTVAAQTSPEGQDTLPAVEVREKALAPEGKDTLRATSTRIGKSQQALRDVPQSVTVVTEKLMDDRKLETVKEALKNTSGISFLAAEGGEEDIRLRGFSLQGTGDIFVDGMRDPAFYDRDTFNLDRMEVLRGSASMLFGRGSTGGAVNQVSKLPRAINEHEVSLEAGSGGKVRLTGDFNIHTGDDQALRINVMRDHANNNGSGTRINKSGIAAAYRWGIGRKDEFLLNLYHLDNRNGINYGLPWLAPAAGRTDRTILPVASSSYYGMASDYNNGKATWAGLQHIHRFDNGGELTTQLRKGWFKRDQRASTIRLASSTTYADTFGDATRFNRGTQLKIQDMETLQLQSDYTGKFRTGSVEHAIQAGVDMSIEEKDSYAPRTKAQGGVDLVKPTTVAGSPNDGAWIDESQRVLYRSGHYKSTGFGAYVQDTMQLAPHWKLVAGLRYDWLKGSYDTYSLPANAPGPFTTSHYDMKVSEWSKRAGLLYQPTDRHSFHFSYGTSFNTSGDAYSLGASNATTPPEKSRNIEIGAKIDSEDKQWSARIGAFHSTKYNERNTDPLLSVVTLSGQRHVAGLEMDIAGRLTPEWEIYASYMYMPIARVDKAAPCPATGSCSQGQPGERVGDRPALTPKHSGTVWSTYRITPQWRVGAGLNFRGRQRPTRSEFEVPAFATVDLMAEYTYSQQLSFKANVTNAGNRRYADQLYPGHYIPGAERGYYLTATYRF